MQPNCLHDNPALTQSGHAAGWGARGPTCAPNLLAGGGFTKCLYPLQKFGSDSERRFAVILERDASKWFKPAKGQFQIYYKLGTEQPEYVPDFVVETDAMINHGRDQEARRSDHR